MTLLDPQPPALGDPARRTDAALIAAVRAGDRTAYAQLYQRHEPAARRMARQLCTSPHDADDLVAEAFARVLDQLRLGRGPDSAFRAYLLTAVRNGLYERARRDRKLELTDDMARHDSGVPWIDPVEAELNSALAAQAFASLPKRWQTVLWYSEVEQESTAQVGSRLGLRPNAVAALAYRAREGLRQAYLQAHVTGGADGNCRATVAHLGGWTRDRLSSLETARVDEHLTGCRRCSQLAAELADVNSGLRGSLAPFLLAASAHFAAPTATAVGAASAVTAISAGGAASAAGMVGAGAGSVGGSVLGSLAGWAAAVVVGGTAVAAGVTVPHAVHRPPAAVAPAPVPPAGAAPRTTGPVQLSRARPGPAVPKVHPPKKPAKHTASHPASHLTNSAKGGSPKTAKTAPNAPRVPKAAAKPAKPPQAATKPPANKATGGSTNAKAASSPDDKPASPAKGHSKPAATKNPTSQAATKPDHRAKP